jgi:RNA polymerase sigma-70 factor, ECF subfamily
MAWKLACLHIRAPNGAHTKMTLPNATNTGTRTDEAILIRKIVGGHQDLFGDLITPHLALLSRIVRTTLGAHAEVEDVVQQTALKAFTQLAQFRFEAGFRTWLIQIGLNEARQWRRKYASSPLVKSTDPVFAEVAIADQSRSPFMEYQRVEASAQVGAAIDRLPEIYRTVIVLRDLQDLSISEVARRLGLTIPAVKSRHMRARQKVARFLDSSREFRPKVAFAGDHSGAASKRSQLLHRTT